jgi:hypothetical protein
MLAFGSAQLIDACPTGEEVSVAVTDDKGTLSKGYRVPREVLQWIRFRP